MTILALETSCDETGAAIIVNGQIKSNILASQAKTHLKYGGVVPEVAAREHVLSIIPTINLALKKAKTKLAEIDYIAVTKGPGLMTSLMVGVDTAKTLGLTLNKPVLPINHLEAHIYANVAFDKLRQHKSLIPERSRRVKFPAIILIVSGGHTMLVLMRGHGQYKIIGETVDDAAGEAFDKTARLLGLPYPGGPHLSKLAKNGNPHAFKFPRPMINSDDLNFSFSGLKTAVLYEVQKLDSRFRGNGQRGKLKANLAASVQQAIVDVLIAKTEQAIKKYQPKTIMLGGGVAANDLLRARYKLLAKSYQLSVSIPPLKYCTDNAAMIGLAAHYKLLTTHYPDAEIVRSRLRPKRRSKLPTKTFVADPNLALA
ncbi:MAG: tRNA (adenosine(37)-N6)-threonylcarbamoyltransferase complex transferase subunit TsaD [Candidatus Doudnabacteria bacterium]|nr:tRNA (adenosine(37)-N6)-threonylcarbamoyltransferase complex transferase subunit TsaD [Candidatus Doudnabacteria bacterium]